MRERNCDGGTTLPGQWRNNDTACAHTATKSRDVTRAYADFYRRPAWATVQRVRRVSGNSSKTEPRAEFKIKNLVASALVNQMHAEKRVRSVTTACANGARENRAKCKVEKHARPKQSEMIHCRSGEGCKLTHALVILTHFFITSQFAWGLRQYTRTELSRAPNDELTIKVGGNMKQVEAGRRSHLRCWPSQQQKLPSKRPEHRS